MTAGKRYFRRFRIGLEVPNGRVFYGQHPGQAGRTLVEHVLRDELAAMVGGITEASLPYGQVDVLIETTAFEVKPVAKWRRAVGQALQYSAQTGCEPAVALFGRADRARVLDIYIRLRDGDVPVQLWWRAYRWERIGCRRDCRSMPEIDLKVR